MKNMIIVIAISSVLVLTACSKSDHAKTSDTTANPAPMTEQNNPTLSDQQTNPNDQTMEGNSKAMEKTEQAAFETGSAANEKSEETGSTADSMNKQ